MRDAATSVTRSNFFVVESVAIGGQAASFPLGKASATRRQVAETEGFEPSIPLTGYDDLANRCLQPLGHVSVGRVFAREDGEGQ